MVFTRRRTLFLLTLFLLLVLALLAFLAFDTDDAVAPSDESAFRGCAPEEAATEAALTAIATPTPFGPDISSAELNRPESAAPFVGRLCDFEIVATEGEVPGIQICEGEVSFNGGPDAVDPQFSDSELNSPNMTEQVLCDGTPIAVYGGEGRRLYFEGEARVYGGGTPRLRLRVTDVDGHPVLVILPRSNPGVFFFHAIERMPSDSRPGILLAGGHATTYEETIEKARAALSD